MTAGVRWRVAGAVAVCAAALLPLGGARWAAVRAERAFAEGMTRTVASYLALATPPARGSADYNLGLLLIRARSLVTLPGWTPEVEVYHGTAPLVSPTELPLPAAEFERLRRVETIRWRHGAALVPLKDRDDWDVVRAQRGNIARLVRSVVERRGVHDRIVVLEVHVLSGLNRQRIR